MSTQTRALLIGLLGPALQTLGLLWIVIDVAIDSGKELTSRYVVFDPGHLVIAVGILVSAVCIPVAFQTAAAASVDVELETFKVEIVQESSEIPAGVAGGRWEQVE